MSAPDLQSQVDRNPVETPLYAVGEASHCLRAPVWEFPVLQPVAGQSRVLLGVVLDAARAVWVLEL